MYTNNDIVVPRELVIFRFDGTDERSPLRTVEKVIVPSSVGPTGTMAAQGDYVVFERVLSQHEPIVWSRTANKFAVYHLQNTNIGSKVWILLLPFTSN